MYISDCFSYHSIGSGSYDVFGFENSFLPDFALWFIIKKNREGINVLINITSLWSNGAKTMSFSLNFTAFNILWATNVGFIPLAVVLSISEKGGKWWKIYSLKNTSLSKKYSPLRQTIVLKIFNLRYIFFFHFQLTWTTGSNEFSDLNLSLVFFWSL